MVPLNGAGTTRPNATGGQSRLQVVLKGGGEKSETRDLEQRPRGRQSYVSKGE
jgi:hypothetical protein